MTRPLQLAALLLLALSAGCISSRSPSTTASAPSASQGPLAARASQAASGRRASEPSSSSWLPLFGRLDDPDGTTRTLAAGPLHETAAAPSGATVSAPLRPFYSTAADPAAARTNWESLWPVAQGKTFHSEQSGRILTAWWRDADPADPAAPYRFMFLPFWFNGRDATGHTHAALFPVGGTIDHFLMKDRIAFFLFPLWARSQISDLTTTDVLWPVFSRTTSADGHASKFRVFPFYLHSFRTNQFEKTSVLWPFWTHSRYDFPASRGTSWLLFPVFGRVNLGDQQGVAVLPPLFTRVVATNGNSRTQILWPIYRRDTGPRPYLRVWPFYGHRTDGPLDKKFWLWPLLTREENAWAGKHYLRWTFAPFYSRRTLDQSPPPADPASPESRPSTRLASRTQLWPLFTHTYANERGEDSSRLAIPDLWPGPTPGPVARLWAPLWTLYDRRAAAGASQIDILWGLWHSERAPDRSVTRLFPLWGSVTAPSTDTERHWSLLKGLLAYDRAPSGSRRLRLLWLPIPLSPDGGPSARHGGADSGGAGDPPAATGGAGAEPPSLAPAAPPAPTPTTPPAP